MVMFRMIMILEVILALSNNYLRLDKKNSKYCKKNMILISANNYGGNTDGIRVKKT